MEDADRVSFVSSVKEPSVISENIPAEVTPEEVEQDIPVVTPLALPTPSPVRSETPSTQPAPIAPSLTSPKQPSPQQPSPQQPSPLPSPSIGTAHSAIRSTTASEQITRDMSTKENKSPKSQSVKSGLLGGKIMNAINTLVKPAGQTQDGISEKVDNLKQRVQSLASDIVDSQSNNLTTNIDKIATMSKALTSEANALRQSIKSLSEDIARTKQELCYCGNEEDINFPYHLFLIEIIINKIHMKCECFEIDYNNLVISAVFLGKPPIILYDSSFGKIENFNRLNVGKSTLFAMTYDKICGIKDFEIVLLLTKQPPCSTCVTKIAETHLDYTNEFISLREELCKKWMQEQPADNILCTTSTPLSKNMYYLSCCDGENRDSIGVIEVTVRMSFLGKEITTAFCASPKPQGTSFLLKEDHGMTMYSCHKVEMDDQGKILLDEGVLSKKAMTCGDQYKRSDSPASQMSSALSRRSYEQAPQYENHHGGESALIFSKLPF